MDSDRKALLWSNLSSNDIRTKVYEFHNYDGVKMNRDLQIIERHDRAKQYARASAPVWLGMTAFSAYNVTRMGVLSKTGQAAAVTGLLVGAYFSQSSLLN